MKTKLNNKWILFTIVVWLFSCQGLFWLVQNGLGQRIVDSVQSQLRQDLDYSDFNYLARSISDYTSTGSIRCGVLEKISPEKLSIINLKYMDRSCDIGPLWLKGASFDVRLTASNGDIYRFQFISNNSMYFYLALWGFRILGIIAVVALISAVKFLSEKNMAVLEAQIEASKKIDQTLKQVSHDIRSPLAALKMTVEDSEGIPLEYQQMIVRSVQRINDLANNLLIKKEDLQKSVSELKVEMIVPLLDSLISEKRMEFRNLTKVKIELDLSRGYGGFVKIDSVEMKRVLSNLINNSVEAFKEINGEKRGEVHIQVLVLENSKVMIVIDDNGRGMPQEIVAQLGQRGFSHGKKEKSSGYGLGFSHAKETILKFGGQLIVESKEGLGTKIQIELPLIQSPSWFLKEIDLSQGQSIFVLDDDENMLKAWNDRFLGKAKTFNSSEVFIDAIKNNNDRNFLALIDFELEKQGRTGVEVIRLLKIECQSVLVTSHFDEVSIQDTCLNENIKLLPKSMASLVPIQQNKREKEYYDVVFIDDEEILRIVWKQKAEKKKIKILTLQKVEELKQYEELIHKDLTKIYIDNNLKNNGVLKGIDHANDLYKKGYKNVFLATGDDADKFSEFPWIKIIGKECPF